MCRFRKFWLSKQRHLGCQSHQKALLKHGGGNLQKLSDAGRFFLVKAALASKLDFATFYDIAPGMNSLSLPPADVISKFGNMAANREIEVLTVTLDAVVDAIPFTDTVELVKTDTQGHDLDVMGSLQRQRNRVQCMIVEKGDMESYLYNSTQTYWTVRKKANEMGFSLAASIGNDDIFGKVGQVGCEVRDTQMVGHRWSNKFPPFFEHPELIKWMKSHPELYGPNGGPPLEEEIAPGFDIKNWKPGH